MRISNSLWYALALVVLVQPLQIQAQEDLHHDDRVALLKILTEVEAAINEQDIEHLIREMRPDCTVTWWNAEISRGHEQIRAYYKRMVKDDGRIISKYTTKAKLGDHARFLGSSGDTAVADGSMEDTFYPIIRGPFSLNSRWSVTLSKSSEGDWKIVSLHLSSNVFNNVLIDELKKAMWLVGVAAMAIGGLAGWLRGRRSKRAV
jgi:ketosteroid isomerase-like protein